MKTRILILALCLALTLSLAACAGAPETKTSSSPAKSADSVGEDYNESAASVIVFSGSSAAVTGAGAEADGAVVTIKSAGTYIVTGESDNGQLIVDAGKEDEIQIVLRGVSLSSAESCPLLILQTAGVTLTLDSGTENSLSDAGDYDITAGDATVDAVIFSKDDLTIGGGGVLTVTGNMKHGIVSKDTLTIENGVLNVTAVQDGLQANDAVTVKGGEMTISAGDDGIHSDGTLTIEDGSVTVTDSYEGLEAGDITLAGGKVSVTASDDGLNASGGSDGEQAGPFGGMDSFSGDSSLKLVITGGHNVIDAGGDGLDSNGSIEVSGGVTLVSGPTNSANGALDYGTAATISGGVVIAAGASGMSAGFSDDSAQGSILVNVDTQEAGTPVALCDENGAVLCSFTPMKQYQNVVVSCPGIASGATYTLQTGAVSGADENGWAENADISDSAVLATITMTSLHYSEGGGMGDPGGNTGGMGGGNRGDWTGGAPSRDGSFPADGTAPDFPDADAAAA